MIADAITSYLKLKIRHGGRYSFLKQLDPQASILDVGCGNGSLSKIRETLPLCRYTGLDVFPDDSYKNGENEKFVIADPKNFDTAIAGEGRRFDAVISRHNLEHCNDRDKTLSAILGTVIHGGQLFISFPSAESVNFPEREGTLNYYDDSTHVGIPPDFPEVTNRILESGFEIEFSARNFRPLVDRVRGFLNEPKSRKQNRLMAGTWDYYGFESIIWARNATPTR
ncbi:MAG: SAM-dependent methyltransferase [Paracoccaceae bacterium]|jgi:SAM-dependent methyltransferase